MAKYNGLITIEGQIDGLSFYKTADGTFVRRAGGVKKSRIMNDGNFARTRENMSEFSEVAKSNKLMRNSFGYLLEKYKDSKMQARLTSKLYEVLRNDTVSDRGESYRDWETDRKSTRLNSSHRSLSRMPSSA